MNPPAFPLFGLNVLFLFVIVLMLIPATICGWVAASRIKRSEGKLYGLRLAAFAGLFFPGVVLFLIPVVCTTLVIRLSMISDKEPSVILGVAVFITFAFLCVKVFSGLWRKILGKGRIRQTFGLKKNKYGFGFLVILWIVTGVLLFVQRPRQEGKVSSAESLNFSYQAEASTWRQMHIFGRDRLTYRFTLEGKGGSIQEEWEIPVPFSKTKPEYVFSERGIIQWRQDSSLVFFMVDGRKVFQIETKPLRGFVYENNDSKPIMVGPKR